MVSLKTSAKTSARLSVVATVVALVTVGVGTAFAPPQDTSKGLTGTPADRAVRDMCEKQVALLGESPTHGFGESLVFKADVVRRLVDTCYYNAFFIESGAYDFLNIKKKLKSGQPVTGAMIAAAIGGLWANREVEALIPFLLERAQSGKLALGGLDDQLGRGAYAQHGMAADITAYLQGEPKTRCLSIFERHLLWQYTDAAPYGPKDKALILRCVDAIQSGIGKASDTPGHEYDLAMTENLKRLLARDFNPSLEGSDDAWVNARDESMYQNFRWFMSRLPAHSKVIVWTANVHAAKDLSGVPGKQAVVSLGSYIRHEFKDRAFALGCSALSGSYAMGRQPVRQLSAAPENSLEARAFAGNEFATHYFDLDQLRDCGTVPGRIMGADFKTAKWDQVLDGLVVFRVERPPELTNPN